MTDGSLVALLARTMISLAVVLAVVAVGYRIAKRRASGTASGSRGSGLSSSMFRGRRPKRAAPIEIVGRVGLTRNAAAVAIRFGDRVVLVSASDQGTAAVLAEMPGEEWDELNAAPEDAETPSGSGVAGAPTVIQTRPPSFIEALRQATSRHE
jgi:hypothetical protein